VIFLAKDVAESDLDAHSAWACVVDAQMTTAAAPVGRQDFLIPRAANQLFCFRAGAPLSYIEVWRTRLSPAISRKGLTRAMCHLAKSSVCTNAGITR
jgi:hypothetical protein